MFVKLSPTASEKGNIPYQRSRPLSYADFKGQPLDINTMAVATTQTGLTVKYRTETRGLQTEGFVTVFVEMYPGSSWMKEQGRNPATLRHEQLHFDIAALWACKLKDTLAQTHFEPEAYRRQIQALQDAYEAGCWEEQQRYDRETMHSTDKAMQAKWEADIAQRLALQSCFL